MIHYRKKIEQKSCFFVLNSDKQFEKDAVRKYKIDIFAKSHQIFEGSFDFNP